jgi:hypothetical protein
MRHFGLMQMCVYIFSFLSDNDFQEAKNLITMSLHLSAILGDSLPFTSGNNPPSTRIFSYIINLPRMNFLLSLKLYLPWFCSLFFYLLLLFMNFWRTFTFLKALSAEFYSYSNMCSPLMFWKSLFNV